MRKGGGACPCVMRVAFGLWSSSRSSGRDGPISQTHVDDLQRLPGGFAVRYEPQLGEGRVDRRVDVLLECRVACRLGLPDIDVTQTAVFAAHAHVRHKSGHGPGG